MDLSETDKDKMRGNMNLLKRQTFGTGCSV